MPISVTDLLGATKNSTAAGVAISNVTVPAGALIVALTNEQSANTSSGGLVADTVSNTYTSIVTRANGGAGGSGPGQVWYAWNVTPLVSGAIEYLNVNASSPSGFAAFYATGIVNSSDPLDTNVTAASVGNSTNPSVTSGTPSIAGELFVGGLTWIGSSADTFTQDSANGAYAAPFDSVAGSTQVASVFAGGNLVNAGVTAKSYAPTISAAHPWADFIVGFKAGGPAIGWFMPIAEPSVKVKPWLGAPSQQALIETLPLPSILFTAATAMPVFEYRFQYQALSTVIPRLMPKPNILGTMNLKELKDAFLGGAMIFNAPNGGEIGISERLASQVGEIGVSERPTPGNEAITGGGIGVTQR